MRKDEMTQIIKKSAIPLLIVAMLYFTYRTFISWQNYTVIRQSDTYIALIGQLQKSIEALEKERLASARYLGTKGKEYFTDLAKHRDESDRELLNLEQWLNQNRPQIEINEILPSLRENLKYVRSRVDVLHDDYNSILLDYYNTKSIALLIRSINRWLDKLAKSVRSVHPYFTTYRALNDYQETLNLEESYILYMTLLSKPMTMSDLNHWEAILQKEYIPDISPLSDKPVYHLVKKALKSVDFRQELRKLRTEVLSGSNRGNYLVSGDIWQNRTDKIISQIADAQNTLFDYIRSLDFKSIVPVALYTNLALLLLFSVILYLLYRDLKKPLPLSASKDRTENPDIAIKHLTYREESSEVPLKDLASPPLPETLTPPVGGDNNPEEGDDLPLTNIAPVKNDIEEVEKKQREEALAEREKERRLHEKTFSPIKLFKEVIRPFIHEAQQAQVAFHYAIDPALPDICLGEPDKIKNAAILLLNYTLQNAPTRSIVTMRVENVAQKKFETALSFRIKAPGTQISKTLQRQLRKVAIPQHIKGTAEEDLFSAAEMLKQIDGSLRIENKPDEETEFAVSVNLKRFIPAE